LLHLIRAARRLFLVVPVALALAPASAHAAAELAILPSGVDFGAHPAGAFADRTVTVRNLGPDPTALSDVYIEGTGVDQFDFVDGTCLLDEPMAVAAECQLTMRFSTAPGASGAFEAFLWADGGPDDLSAVARLTGSVQTAWVRPASVVVEPSQLVFPPTLIGALSPAQSVRIRNEGEAPATGLSVRPRLGMPFKVANGCPAVLDPGAQCAVDVVFSPTLKQSNSGSLMVSWNERLRSLIGLSGTVGAAGGCPPSRLPPRES
jgi:hypothetical protein